ncbi:MAG: inositol monophosphatase [Candidatus Micrarchaeota archaeon]
MNELKELENVCVEAVKVGGAVSKKYFRKSFAISFKGDRNDAGTVVTQADLESEKAIVALIKSKYPDHAIVAEEAGGEEGDGYSWFIDPVDGTQNFSRGFVEYGVSVGVVRNGEPVAGAVYIPELGELYRASKGNGAFLNDERIHASKNSIKDSIALVSAFLSFDRLKKNLDVVEKLAPHIAGLRVFGCASYGCALIARGGADVSIKYDLMPENFCGGVPLIREAGGFAVNANGEPWTTKDKTFIAAANKKLLDDVLELIK